MSAPSSSKSRQRLSASSARTARVGARHNQDVGVGARVDRGADLHARFFARDHLLAAGVAAFSGRLILEHNAGRPRARIR